MEPRPEPTLIAAGALGEAASWLVSKEFRAPLLVCDDNTYDVAAGTVEASLRSAGIPPRVARLSGTPVLADEVRLMETFAALTADVDVVVSVGSGTLTDIGRFVAHRGNRRFVALPTAVSVDGFYSAGAPLILRGVKRTIVCGPPEALFFDLDVISQSPRRLTAAGLGDLSGKLTSWADWNLGRLLWNEPFDETISTRSLSVGKQTMDLASEIGRPTATTYSSLAALLVESGACMVDFGESRPASGAEHHLSHFWEMRFLREGADPPLHGAKVGYAGRLISGLYAHIRDLAPSDVESATTPPSGPEEDRAALFHGYPEAIAEQLVADQKAFLDMGPEERLHLRARALEAWDDIQDIASYVPSPDRFTSALKDAGGPTTAKEVGIDPGSVADGLRYCHFIRSRFTILKLFRLLGIDPVPIARGAVGGEF